MRTCSHCGEGNPDRFQFCGACGQPLPPSSTSEARKVVTCVFCDVTGSTALGESLDPEAIRAIMNRFFEEMRAVLLFHGGTIEKFIGDAVMAVFGIPEIHEDDALRAVRAASDMQAKLASLNEDLVARYGTGIKIRTGINTGEVLAGDASEGQAFASGDTVNVAARLEQVAPPGDILLGDATYRLVRDVIEAEPVEPLEAKGKSEPVPAWKLVSVSDIRHGPVRNLSSQLVGRDQELAAMVSAFDEAVTTGSCRLVTILGAAGLGKTRLTSEFIKQVGDRALVFQGRCLSYGEGMTFWPVAEVVRAAAGIGDSDSPEDATEKIKGLVVGSDQDVISRQVASVLGLGEAGGEIQEIFWAIRKFLEALAVQKPVVLFFDDIHWAESTFLDLIEYVGNFTSSVPILLLCATRPDVLQTRPGWPSVTGSLEISLKPLDGDDSSRLIRSLLDNANLPSAIQELITRSAEGNPLFVEELLRMLVEDGLLIQTESGWQPKGELSTITIPETINALLASRLDRLTPAERDVIQRAGVVGIVFWWGAVADLSEASARSGVGGHLQSLVRRQLIRPDDSSFHDQDAYRFGHGLIRESAYQSMPKALKSELHVRFVDWLERVAKESTSDHAEIVGYHLEQAFRYKEELGLLSEADFALGERAAEQLVHAGRRALDHGDVAAASSLLLRAHSLLPPGDSKRIEFLTPLWRALTWSGRFAEATTVVEQAQATVTDGDAISRAHVRLADLGVKEWNQQEESAEAILGEIDSLIELFRSSEDVEGLATALDLKASAHWLLNQSLQAMEARQEIANLEGVMEAQRNHALYYVFAALALGPVAPGEVLDWCERFDRPDEGKLVRAGVLQARALTLGILGRFAEARLAGLEWVSTLSDLGLKANALAAAQITGEVELLSGNSVRAEELLGNACVGLEELGETSFMSTTMAILAYALCEQERWEDAVEATVRAQLAGASDDISTEMIWRGARAKAYAHIGRVEEAEELAREGVSFAERSDFPFWTIRAFLTLSEVLALNGKKDEAITHLETALGLARSKGHKVFEGQIRESLVALT